MKPEYIDRNALIDDLIHNRSFYPVIVKNAIKDAPVADVAPVVHGKWIPTTKHKWRTDEDGEVDEMAWCHEYHNGPVCTICNFSPCIHCKPDWEKDDECYEHFVCSECGSHEEEKFPYCHCGAKMDGGKE